MAKKAGLRIHQLAKELGVTSKDLVAKCKAEDIPGIANHMSTVSLGLAATIREWFGDAGNAVVTTAVETAAPVDVVTARAKAKKKVRKKPVGHENPEMPASVAVVEAPVEPTVELPAQPEVEAPPAPPEQVPVAYESPSATEVFEASTSQDPASEITAADDVAPETIDAPAEPDTSAPDEPTDTAADESPIANVPQRPSVVTPAGPKLTEPTKTKLAGPKVIRVEQPEVLPPRRTRTAARGPAAPGDSRTGRGPGDRGGPAGAEPPAVGRSDRRGSSSSRRNKRRSGAARDEGARTGRTGSAGATGGDRPFNWREQDLLERDRRLSRSSGFFKAARRDNLKRSTGGGHRAKTAAEVGGQIQVEAPITLKVLSSAVGLRVNDMVRSLVRMGKPLVSPDAPLDNETAIELMVNHDIELEIVEQKSAEDEIMESFQAREFTDKRPRSAVVTILGHVDHGKTSLLDSIRKTKVAEGEAGGITQATSAFQVPVHAGEGERLITFIDTPGHEAFTAMRARGAKVTDLVVLVVAADDGVMPQTVESINHAKAADVPLAVALNKIDKPEATDTNIQRILGQLAEHDLNPAEWGGSIEVVRTNATTGEGVQDLLDVLDYQAQLSEFQADFGGRAEGTVLEATLKEGRGAVANILVQQGKLKKGDYVVAGRSYGRVRDLVDDQGNRLQEVTPSMPVAVSGLNELPDAGDKFYVVKNQREAEAAATERRDLERQRELAAPMVTLDNIFEHLAESEVKELPLVVKADVHGSLETLGATLDKIKSDEVKVAIKHAAVGGVNDSDVTLAEATGSIIIAFNVTSSSASRKAAEDRNVDIRYYDVIYDVTDDVTKAAEGLLAPEVKLEVLGHAEVRQVFKISKVGMIAGCYVTDGLIERHAQIRITRDEIVIEKDRRLEQLKRFKDDAKEVRAGQECGMKIEGYDDIRAGDVLECYRTHEVRRSL